MRFSKVMFLLFVILGWALQISAYAATVERAYVAGAEQITDPSPETKARINANYGKIPLSFEANTGQTNKKVKFLSRGQGYGLYLTPSEAVMILNARKPDTGDSANPSPLSKGDRGGLPSDTSILRMSLANANKHPKLVGEEMQASKSSYFVGKNSQKWHTDIGNYGKVRYEEVYKGIDLVYYGNQRKLEYDFIVQPGADYKKIRMRFKGADKVSIDDNGNLVLHTKNGDVVQHKPVVYQTETGDFVGAVREPPLRGFDRKTPTGKYVILANAGGTVCLECGDVSPPIQSADKSAHSKTKTGAASGSPTGTLVGFEVENYDPAKPLVIDPLIYSTYLGGAGGDETTTDIAIDSSGNAYVTGYTNSTNFPTSSGAYQVANNGHYNVFVTKLNSSGTALVYSAYLGGNGYDYGYGIAVDSSGNAYVTGNANSTNFPTTSGAYQTAHGGGYFDAFVAKLNSTGTALVYSTYLGGSGADEVGFSIAVDSSGNAYVTGYTNSTNFPTISGAYQTTLRGGYDAFITKLNPSGASLVYSTYLGGSSSSTGYTQGHGIYVDSSGNAYVTGETSATNFSTTSGAYQTTLRGGYDAFITKLNPSGASLAYSTYLGGSNDDRAYGITVDSSGNAYVAGYTISSYNLTFPTTSGAYQTVGGTGFITKLNPSGASLVYSTYLGGNNGDFIFDIAGDSSDNVYVTGYTHSNNFPTTSGAYQATLKGGQDVFISKLNSSGALAYSTYLGETNGYNQGNSIAVDSSGNAYVTGKTSSAAIFPTTSGAYQTTHNGGGYDAFIVGLSLEVNPLNSATTIISSLNPSTASASVTFTATVSGSGGTPTGTVAFKDGSTTLGTGTLSNGTATYSTSSLSAGAHSITAIYGGDSTFAASTSSALTQTVTAVITTSTTTVASSLNPSTSGASVMFTATVSGSGGTPTGTVTFKDGSTTLGTGTLSSGQVTYSTSSLSVGTHSITAVYGGNSTFASSTSAVLTQTVTGDNSGSGGSGSGGSGSGGSGGSGSGSSGSSGSGSSGGSGGGSSGSGSGSSGTSDYTGTYYGHGVTIHLQQTGTTLTGRFYIGNSSNGGNIGGIVDSAGRAYAWAWWDNTELGSGLIAGRLTISGSQGTFSFGGGRNTSGRIDEVLLSDMTKSSLAGATTITTSTGTANYAGTYSMTGLSITLRQNGSILSGTFSSGGLTGNVGGFIDSSDRAYIWAYWENLLAGFGVVAGNLSVSGSQATISFGGGHGSDGRIGEAILSGMARE